MVTFSSVRKLSEEVRRLTRGWERCRRGESEGVGTGGEPLPSSRGRACCYLDGLVLGRWCLPPTASKTPTGRSCQGDTPLAGLSDLPSGGRLVDGSSLWHQCFVVQGTATRPVGALGCKGRIDDEGKIVQDPAPRDARGSARAHRMWSSRRIRGRPEDPRLGRNGG